MKSEAGSGAGSVRPRSRSALYFTTESLGRPPCPSVSLRVPRPSEGREKGESLFRPAPPSHAPRWSGSRLTQAQSVPFPRPGPDPTQLRNYRNPLELSSWGSFAASKGYEDETDRYYLRVYDDAICPTSTRYKTAGHFQIKTDFMSARFSHPQLLQFTFHFCCSKILETEIKRLTTVRAFQINDSYSSVMSFEACIEHYLDRISTNFLVLRV